MRPFADTAPEHVEIGFQPDRYAVLRDTLARFLVHEGAAAGRDDPRAFPQEALQDASLAVAKISLPVTGKDLRNRHARRQFDLRIGIDEIEAELLGEATSDRSFAGSHQTDENDRASAEQ